MALYQSRSKDMPLRDKQPTSLVTRTPKKEKILTYTSLTESITSKGKHVSTSLFQTTPTNIQGEYVACMKPPIREIQCTPANPDSLTNHSITTERMMAKKVEPNTFEPPCHKFRKYIETKLEKLLKEYQSQLAQDETTIGTIPLTKMTIDTGTSILVS